jgi:hypothetical protein
MSFIQILTQAAIAGRADIARAPADERVNWAHLSPATTAPVIQWLDLHAPFQAVAGQMLSKGNGTELVLSSSAAVYLIARAIDFGPEAVAASFDRVMAGEPVTHAMVTVVKGVSAASVVTITSGVTVEPISGLFEVNEKALAYAAGARLHRHGGVPTAIVQRVRATPSYSPRPVGLALTPPPPLPFPSIQRVLDAISLVAGAAVIPDVSYTVVEEAGWPTMIAGSIGGSSLVERVVDLTPAQTSALREASELLNEHARGDALTRAMRKLKDAQGRNNDAERALDLGACLEILLMHGEKADNTEIGYKLRMRAAWLLGQNSADRQRIHDLVKSAYNARSKVAHEGVLPPPKSEDARTRQMEELRDTEQLCRDLITQVLRRGWPNWTTTVLQG